MTNIDTCTLSIESYKQKKVLLINWECCSRAPLDCQSFCANKSSTVVDPKLYYHTNDTNLRLLVFVKTLSSTYFYFKNYSPVISLASWSTKKYIDDLFIWFFTCLADNSVLVNGGSQNIHLMQPHIVLNSTQTFSPVKTRRMRQGISNSEPRIKTSQDVPDVNQG